MPPKDRVEETSSNPNKKLGFEVSPQETAWSFAPNFYPDSFTQTKKKELDRYGGSCNGESVSIKKVKNREYHATGVILEGEVEIFNALIDIEGKVDLISSLTKNGGMECFIKNGELGELAGWDPHNRQWMFEYTLDLVSTGRDEYDEGRNSIVTSLLSETGTGTEGSPAIIR